MIRVAEPAVLVGADHDEVGIAAGCEEGNGERIGRPAVVHVVVNSNRVGDEPVDVWPAGAVLAGEQGRDGEAVAGAVIHGPAQRGG